MIFTVILIGTFQRFHTAVAATDLKFRIVLGLLGPNKTQGPDKLPLESEPVSELFLVLRLIQKCSLTRFLVNGSEQHNQIW